MNNPPNNNASQPIRKTEHLRKGRVSIPHTRYFLTLTTQHRKTGLTSSTVIQSLTEQLRNMHKSNDIILHCATFMPDHLHMLFTLGSTLSLAQIIRKFKSLTKPLIESKNIKWQPNYFEHRLRPDTEMEAFALYIYLNPYRKALLSNNAEWQGWILNREYRPEFINNLRDGKYPQIEWLQNELGLQDLIEDPNR